jgi:dephospho-CoA kinase
MENKKIIIGLTGKIASGKTTVANYIKEKYGAEIYGFSKPLRDILQRLYIPMERPNLALLSSIIRKNFGENIISLTIKKDIEGSNSKIIILDGIRRMPDIEEVKKMSNFKLISINTDVKIRYARLLSRGQNEDDSSKTYEDFLNDENKEADKQIPEIMEKAEITIDNNGTTEDLYEQIEKIINNL